MLITAIVSFLLAVTFCFPSIVFILGIIAATYAKTLAFVFCLIFAWSGAIYMEKFARKHWEKKRNERD